MVQSQGHGFHVTTLWSGQHSVGRWMAPSEVLREFEHWHPEFLADPALAADPSHPVSPAAAALAVSRQDAAEVPEREGYWVADFHYADSDRVVTRQTSGAEPVTEGVAEALFRVTAVGGELAEATVYLDQGEGMGLEYWGQMDFTTAPAAEVAEA